MDALGVQQAEDGQHGREHPTGNGGSPRHSYDVDSPDYTDPGPAVVRERVGAAQAGSIVSLYFGHTDTVAAMPGILTDLADRGLRPVTASRLLRA